MGRGGFKFFLAPFYSLVLLALLPSFLSTVRCVVFTHIFFALWLYWYRLERDGRPIRLVWYLLSAVVWANLHGGYAIGLAWLLGLAVLEAFLTGPTSTACKTWLLRFAACSFVTIINPFGWHLWISTARALVAPRAGFEEWGPVSWDWDHLIDFIGFKLMFALALVLLFREWRRHTWRWVDRRAFIILFAFIFLALRSARQTSLFAEVAAALLPAWLPQALDFTRLPRALERLGFAGIWFSVFFVPIYVALMLLPAARIGLHYGPESCPRAAVYYLEEQNVRGKLLVPFNYGSYALWKLRGRMRVSMDGRYDLVYRPATYRRVDDFFFARGDWKTLLTDPTPDAILVPVADPIYPVLKIEAGWKEAYADSVDAVFLPADSAVAQARASVMRPSTSRSIKPMPL
jgi:hypothetical protein